MIYVFACEDCDSSQEISCSVADYNKVKMQMFCPRCGKLAGPVITGGVALFVRAPFPKGHAIVEHAFEDDPPFCKDKAQLKDICAEQETVSRFVEDDM